MKLIMKTGWILPVFFFAIFCPAQLWGKTYYLDGNLSADCVGSTYSIANRNCSGSDGQGYKTLQSAINNLVGSDTLNVRAGTYIRTTNNTWGGSLLVGASGTAGNPTVVQAYPGEQPVICTQIGRCQYNPNPNDTSVKTCTFVGGEGGAACYYPNPAISIGGSYVTVSGFKTYGQVLIGGVHDVLLKNNDLGGGGPHINQGSVVMIDTTGVAYNITIQNNLIHNSVWGEAVANGSAVMGYNFSATIENNDFYDNVGADIRLKDTSGNTGRTIYVRYNYFRTLTTAGAALGYGPNYGFSGIAQDTPVSDILVYQNIFRGKQAAIGWDGNAANGTQVYNNTFINNAVDEVDWQNKTHRMWNNIFYHTLSGHRFVDDQANPTTQEIYDYNCYYSTASTAWYNLYMNRGASLSGWQSYSGADAHSVYKDPLFINPSGTTPGDFKRKSYAGDVATGTPALNGSTVCGAYINGTEVIGASSNFSPPPPPNQATGLLVR